MTAATIAERVAAGTAFLDEHDPEWWRADVERAIDLDGLDLGTGSRCILGQRCPLETVAPFSEQASALSGIEWRDETSGALYEWASAHGFDFDLNADESEYDALTAEWKRLITERRSAS